MEISNLKVINHTEEISVINKSMPQYRPCDRSKLFLLVYKKIKIVYKYKRDLNVISLAFYSSSYLRSSSYHIISYESVQSVAM